jgi:hypothetical protein
VTAIHIVAFGEAADGIWGVAWAPDGPAAPARLAIGRAGAHRVVELALEVPDGESSWSLRADGTSLSIGPDGPAGRGGPAGELESLDQPCLVNGELRLEDAVVAVTSHGWRSTVQTHADLTSVDSIRWLAGWLGPQEGFSLTALRPRKARGHEADLIAAAVIEDPSPPRIEDPRLSTTYAEDGLPFRVGLELWFEAKDEEGSEDAPSHQYPRRAAGETVGRPLDWEAAGFRLNACLVDWRSHGREGRGVYVLARRR